MTDAIHHTKVFAAEDIFVISGVNLDEGLTEDPCMGDIYRLDRLASTHRLPLRLQAEGAVMAESSPLGRAGDAIGLCRQMTLMAPDGDRVELLLLRHEGRGQLYALPLSPMTAHTDYSLVAIQLPADHIRLSDRLCLSFHRGTRVLRATGEMVAVEHLRVGDLLLTRDHGSQPLRWIGSTTLRARGALAPVVVAQGTLGNEADLVIGPHHRLFMYQRSPKHDLPRAEILVQAKHLVDGDLIYRREGGFAEYFSLVFDQHEIIYAEGIPVESLMVSESVRAALPQDLAQDLRRDLPDLHQNPHIGAEIGGPAAHNMRAQFRRD